MMVVVIDMMRVSKFVFSNLEIWICRWVSTGLGKIKIIFCWRSTHLINLISRNWDEWKRRWILKFFFFFSGPTDYDSRETPTSHLKIQKIRKNGKIGSKTSIPKFKVEESFVLQLFHGRNYRITSNGKSFTGCRIWNLSSQWYLNL